MTPDTIIDLSQQALYLIAMIDDASSELTARFALADSTEENMRLLGDYIARHGRPRAGSG